VPENKKQDKNKKNYLNKRKIELTVYNAVNELTNTISNDKTNRYHLEVMKAFCKPSDKFIVKEAGKANLWELITSNLDGFLTAIHNQQKMAALGLRIERFIIKMATAILLSMVTPYEVYAVTEKLQMIGMSIKKVNVITDYKSSESIQKNITPESTLKMIISKLIDAERIVRECIPGLCNTFHNYILDEENKFIPYDYYAHCTAYKGGELGKLSGFLDFMVFMEGIVTPVVIIRCK
jgi:hypothetical protein